MADTGWMTAATTRIERCGPAIRAALAEVSSQECPQFEAELAEALARARAGDFTGLWERDEAGNWAQL
ncbi:MAG: hypothetical protein ACRDRP_25400 [Pseudonocardiaceae bacterium]